MSSERYSSINVKTLAMSARASALKPSPTLSISAKAKQLKESGKDVISFGAGEPDFATPEPIIEAAIKGLKDGKTKYTPTPGIPKLREAIAEKFQSENGISTSADQIIVSCGAKQSLYNAIMTIVSPGDEVVVFAPYWMTYIEQIHLAGGTARIVQTDPDLGFTPRLDDIEKALSDRTVAVILNSPCNPTGGVFDIETLKWIAKECVRRGIWVISDEIYEKLIYEGNHTSIASLGDDIASQTVTINGCSKSFSMTGWRIGYATAPLQISKAMSNLQDQVTSNATSFAQEGALVALNMTSDVVSSMREQYRIRRNKIVELLNQIPGFSVQVPHGAFYALPCIGDHFNGNDAQLADYLLEEALVAVIPGFVFGGKGHIRLSYAASMEDIERGTARIKEFVERMNT